jgi:acyl-CoA thioester hydrolase
MEKTPKSFYRIRFSDCDLLGHLNNARYIDYFLNAREDHLREHYNMDLRDFYRQGTSWVVGSHEILYRKPALYNELVCISSSLIKLTSDFLLVELMMSDEREQQIKSICWTSFIPVSVKTGKKEDHTASFMEFAAGLENTSVNVAEGIRAREAALRASRVASL